MGGCRQVRRLAAAVGLDVTLRIERCGVRFSSRHIERDAESKPLYWPNRTRSIGRIETALLAESNPLYWLNRTRSIGRIEPALLAESNPLYWPNRNRSIGRIETALVAESYIGRIEPALVADSNPLIIPCRGMMRWLESKPLHHDRTLLMRLGCTMLRRAALTCA
jgi:hypothetical protein